MVLALSIARCSAEDPSTTGETTPGSCKLEGASFEKGDPTGHADPAGAKAAGQARAGRITSASQIRQPKDARQKVHVGDFLLANDKIALYIEDKGLSDGYARFGGEILAVDKVGDDGLPAGLSRYGETLAAIGIGMVDPDSVTVVNDGSDGNAAVIRAEGKLREIPFAGFLGPLFHNVKYGLPAAYDYVLEPGAESVKIRMSLMNPTDEPLDYLGDELHGMFHSSRNQTFTVEQAFGTPVGFVEFAGFEGDESWSFAWRKSGGTKLSMGPAVSGFQYYSGPGLEVDACSQSTFDLAEVVAGGPYVDGLLEAIRRVDGKAAWRSIQGSLTSSDGKPVGGAFVHELDEKGKYLSRVKTADDGSFTIHAPNAAVKLVASSRGYPAHEGTTIPADKATATIAFPPNGFIHVVAKDGDGRALPVRVQVIPTTLPVALPESYGVVEEVNGRLHQEFAVSGETTLPVPPGEHRVLVSRGYEYELIDQTVSVQAGATSDIDALVEHSVDTSGVLCADFHIHSHFSADSSDPVLRKVRSALADGLDIPVSSEHEWIVDFQPVIESLGASDWAYGVPSEELTTFTWGHFGVVPLEIRPDVVNNGAIDWVGKEPTEVFSMVRAREEKPFLIVNHPLSSGFGGYFTIANFDNKKGKGRDGFYSDDFDALEVFNDSDFEHNRKASVAAWFSLLEAGKTVFAVGSSDSHSVRTSPVGYPRTCLRFGFDDPKKLSHGLLRDNLRTGNYTVSGGLYMTVATSGGARPGDTVKGSAPVAFHIEVQSPSWLDASDLEVIVNGETVETTPLVPGASKSSAHLWSQDVTVTPAADRPRSWVVFHAKSAKDLAPLHPGRSAFAVSNPVFMTP